MKSNHIQLPPSVVEVEGTIQKSTAGRTSYYFFSVEKCPICNKRHTLQHVTKQMLQVDKNVFDLTTYENTKVRCWPENVFTKGQLKLGARVPALKIVVDLTTPEHREIIRKILKGE